MPRPRRVTGPSDLVDLTVVHGVVYDLEPEWQAPHPHIAGLRTREDVDEVRRLLMAGHPLRTDDRAPRLMTDTGHAITLAARPIAWIYDLGKYLPGLAILIMVGSLVVSVFAWLLGGEPIAAIFPAVVLLALLSTMAATVIDRVILRPAPHTHPLSEDELRLVLDARGAARTVTRSRAYREGYLDQHREMVDLGAAVAAVTRRVVDVAQVARQVETLTGPVRGEADRAMRAVHRSLQTQVTALKSYARHVQELDSHLRDADSNAAAAEIFQGIRGLLASTVEDDLEGARLSDAMELAKATSQAIIRTVDDAVLDVQRLLGTSAPALPQLSGQRSP